MTSAAPSLKPRKAQDAIDQQREDLIGKIEGKLQQETALKALFSVQWTLE